MTGGADTAACWSAARNVLCIRLDNIGDVLLTTRFLANFIFSPQFWEVRASARRVRSMRLILSAVGICPLAGRKID